MRYLLLSGLATFLACIVEMIETLTIILAIGIARQWRSTWYGAACALATLMVLVAIFGSALNRVPLRWLWLVVGGLLLVFGLQWLRNAILRLSGLMATRSEESAYVRIQNEARKEGKASAGLDWYAFVVVYKGVLIEGLEVIFIILAFRASQGSMWIGIGAALAALILVSLVGAVVHRPLSRIPENQMKFVVGILLTSFGTLFGAQGAGAQWPGGEGAIAGILGFYLLVSLAMIRILKKSPSSS